MGCIPTSTLEHALTSSNPFALYNLGGKNIHMVLLRQAGWFSDVVTWCEEFSQIYFTFRRMERNSILVKTATPSVCVELGDAHRRSCDALSARQERRCSSIKRTTGGRCWFSVHQCDRARRLKQTALTSGVGQNIDTVIYRDTSSYDTIAIHWRVLSIKLDTGGGAGFVSENHYLYSKL